MHWWEYGLGEVLVLAYVCALTLIDEKTTPVYDRLLRIKDSERMIFWGAILSLVGYLGFRFSNDPSYIFYSFLAFGIGIIFIFAGFVCKVDIWADD